MLERITKNYDVLVVDVRNIVVVNLTLSIQKNLFYRSSLFLFLFFSFDVPKKEKKRKNMKVGKGEYYYTYVFFFSRKFMIDCFRNEGPRQDDYIVIHIE